MDGVLTVGERRVKSSVHLIQLCLSVNLFKITFLASIIHLENPCRELAEESTTGVRPSKSTLTETLGKSFTPASLVKQFTLLVKTSIENFSTRLKFRSGEVLQQEPLRKYTNLLTNQSKKHLWIINMNSTLCRLQYLSRNFKHLKNSRRRWELNPLLPHLTKAFPCECLIQ